MNWTDERVELLRKLWSEGLSASQIAAQLGGVSRNAVIGKVHRLKLSGRGRATAAPARQKKATQGASMQKSVARAASPARHVTASIGATALQVQF
ncbi:MAG: GcrA cell cycle regulator, partial [Mesorhizobium sp.]